MKALVYTSYGSVKNLAIKDIAVPTPADDEVLIKIKACALNSWDWDLLNGKPYIVRLVYGAIKTPFYQILGADVSGVVESVGKNVSSFKPGDEVFGDLSESGWGGLAEYTCAKESALAFKSPKMSFEEAASLPQAGVMAYQSIYEKKQLTDASKVLIIGAGGGIGTIAVQLAKQFTNHVSVVDKSEKFDLLKSLGATYCIDYRSEDFSKRNEKYDLIIDVVSSRHILPYFKSLLPGGVFAMVGGRTSSLLQAVFIGPLLSRFSSKKLGILAHHPNKYLNELKQLHQSNRLKIVQDNHYTLESATDAFERIGNGTIQGKAVITI